jgi:hypothetical protein
MFLRQEKKCEIAYRNAICMGCASVTKACASVPYGIQIHNSLNVCRTIGVLDLQKGG